MHHDYWLRKDGTIATARHSPITGKSPAELILMAETRRLLQLILANPEAKISDDLRSTISALFRSRARRTAPLTPLPPEQRLAWLDEVTHIVCRAAMPDAFTPGKPYRIKCEDVRTERAIMRNSIQGGPEEILVTGHEILATITDDHKRHHAFCHSRILTEPHIHTLHPLQTLLDHFEIPPAPDITQVYPSTYAKHRQLLSSL